MTGQYYRAETHSYMRYSNHRLAEHLYSLLPLGHLAGFEKAIEFGAGMGRFTAPLIERFERVDLVEPAPDFARLLRSQYPQKEVSVYELTAHDYLEQIGVERCAVFAFHLMHHLRKADRAEIFKAIALSGSCGVFVEPNPFNPLILVQLMPHPDMKFSEESAYLSLTRGAYKREMDESGLKLRHYGKVLFLPPFLTNFLLQKNMPIRWAEKLNAFLPFLSSYQVLVCGNWQ